MSPVPTPAERLENPDAVITRSDLRELGYERRAIDAIFREAASRGGVILLPGYSRPMIRVETYRAVLEESTYGLDRVWPG